jgi:hypothetical protein
MRNRVVFLTFAEETRTGEDWGKRGVDGSRQGLKAAEITRVRKSSLSG